MRWSLKWWLVSLVLVVGVWFATACNAASPAEDCAAGKERCACGAEDTCDAGLACRSNKCVNLGLDSSSSGGAAGADGQSAAGGASGATSGGSEATSGGSGGSGGVGGAATNGSTNGSAGSTTAAEGSTGGSGGASTSGSGGASTSASGGATSGTTTSGAASTTASTTSGAGCTVVASDFLEPVSDNLSFEVPSSLGEFAGHWTLYGDGTGVATITLTSNSVPGGTNSVTCNTSGFSDWGGCLMVFGTPLDLTNRGRNALHFWARAATSYAIRVNVSDRNSDLAGGVCVIGEECTQNCCYDHYGAEFSANQAWTEYIFRFDELARVNGNGPDAAFDPSYLREIGFRPAGSGDFELEIDELTFISCD